MFFTIDILNANRKLDILLEKKQKHRILNYLKSNFGSVAQMVRALACHARGRGFKSLPDRQYALIAQSVEQRTENPCVGGSIPPQGTIA